MYSLKRHVRSVALALSEAGGILELLLRLRSRLRAGRDRANQAVRLPGRVAIDRRASRSAEVVRTWYLDRWTLAHPCDRLDAGSTLRSNVDVVVEALERASIPYFIQPLDPGTRGRVCVESSQRSRVLAALDQLNDLTLSLIPCGPLFTASKIDLPHPNRLQRRRALHADVWQVFRNLADGEGRAIDAAQYACGLEFWTPGPDGHELRSPRWNKRSDAVGRSEVGAAHLSEAGRTYPTVESFTRATHVDDITFPIDLVYTWVDGNDPAWIERKNAVLRSLDLDAHNPTAADLARFASREELRFSLRSVAAFAPWVRSIVIVTDDQTPEWLDVEHPQIRLVSHKEIFADYGRLPTFNSHAIESQLHHIEGLSEHYIYMNDDFFFGRIVDPEKFFHANGLSKFFLSSALMGLGPASKDTEPVDAAARNTRALLAEHFGRMVSRKFKHAPYPQRRSVLFEMEEQFAEAFEQTARNQIRSPDDTPVASSFYHYYAYLTDRAVPAQLSNKYVDLGEHGFDRVLTDLERARNFDTLCINDTDTTDERELDAQQRVLSSFFESYWPARSPFER